MFVDNWKLKTNTKQVFMNLNKKFNSYFESIFSREMGFHLIKGLFHFITYMA